MTDFEKRANTNETLWVELKIKLPWQNNEIDRQLREKQWAQIDCNGNGFASLAEIDKGIKAVIQLPTLFDLKPVIMRAFQAAKTSVKSKSSNDDEYVTKAEYHFLLKYLRQYYEYWVAFDSIDISHDKRVSKEEFIKAVALLEKWGINMSDVEAQWKECDSDGSGMILFSGFCDWAIKKNLDLDNDDEVDSTDMLGIKTSAKSNVLTKQEVQQQAMLELKTNIKNTQNQAVWDELKNKLPWQNTEMHRQLREKQWAQIDCNGNGFASLAEIDKGIKAVIQLPTLFDLKPVIMRAFQAAKTSVKSKSSNDDEYVTKAEYRFLLKYLRQYYEYWVAFDSIDISHDKRVSKEEFIKAMALLEKWGINMSDEEAQWKECDSDGSGMILFSGFCDWAIKKNLDLDNDDDLDIQDSIEIKLVKVPANAAMPTIEEDPLAESHLSNNQQTLQSQTQLYKTEVQPVKVNDIQPITTSNLINIKHQSLRVSMPNSESIKTYELLTPKMFAPLKMRKVKQGVNISSVMIDTPLNEVDNSLEFIVVTLSRAFDLKPMQSTALLTNKSQYLLAACVKGFKNGRFDPVLVWYDLLNENIQNLCELVASEFKTFNDQSSTIKMLDILSSGFCSFNFQVLTTTFKLFTKMFTSLIQNDQMAPLAMQWFHSKDGGLKLTAGTILKDNDCAEMVVDFWSMMCQVEEQIIVLYKDELHSQCPDDYVRLILEILSPMNKMLDAQSITSCGLIEHWIEMCARNAENDGKHKVEERIAALTLLTEVWLAFTNYVDSKDEMVNTILFMLKRALREKTRVLKLTASGHLFTLLEKFAVEKNPSAPLIYKALVFSIVENPTDPTIREFYYSNFKVLFKKNVNIPIGLLLDPLLKLLTAKTGYQLELQTFDIDFFNYLASHPKITVAISIPLMTLLQKLCLNELGQSNAIIAVYINLIDRYSQIGGTPAVTAEVISFIHYCLQKIYQIKEATYVPDVKMDSTDNDKGKSSKFKKNAPKQPKREQVSVQQLEKFRLKIGVIANVIQKIQKINDDNLNDGIKYSLQDTQERLLKDFHQSTGTVDRLLAFYNIPSSLQIRQEPSQSSVPDETSSSLALIPFNHKSTNRSFIMTKQKVLQNLVNIRKTKFDKEEIARVEEEKSRDLKEKVTKSLKKQIERRRVELGVEARKPDGGQVDGALILEEKQNVVALTDEPVRRSERVSRIHWFEIEDEEEREVEAITEVMKRFQKLWRNLFQKYSNTMAKNRGLIDKGNFDSIKNLAEVISVGEITKLLKDHDVMPKIVSKEEIASLIKIIGQRTRTPNLTNLDYKGYQTFLQQLSFNVYNYASPSDRLKRLLSQFREATETRGLSIILYEDPDSAQDSEIIAALNEKVENDPSYMLPEGYQKIRERSQIYSYELPPALLSAVGMAKAVSAELLDEIISETFDFHFLEPMISYDETIKVKQILRKPKVEEGKAQALSFMKDFNSKLQPKPVFEPKQKMVSQLSIAAKVNLPTSLRLLVNDSDPSDRKTFEEAAQSLELILQAVERGSDDIYKKANKLSNQVIVSQKLKAEEEKRANESRDRKRKQRNESLKRKIELEREQKAEKDDILKQERIAKEQREKSLAIKRKESARADIARIVNEALAKKEEQALQHPALNVSSVNTPKSKEQLTALQKEFFQKQRNNHKSNVNKLQEIRSQVSSKEAEAEQKQQLLKDAVKRKVEKQLLAGKEDRMKEQIFHQQIKDFLGQSDIADVMQQYSKCLEKYFKFYCQQGKTDIGFDMQFKQNNLNYKEFIKFGFQSKVVPVLVTSDEMITIFRTVAKQSQNGGMGVTNSTQMGTTDRSEMQSQGSIVADKNTVQYIDLNGFKSALVRIAVFGHEYLGGLSTEQISHKVSIEQGRRDSEAKVKDYQRRKESLKKELSDKVNTEMRQEWEDRQLKSKVTLSKSPKGTRSKLLSSKSQPDKPHSVAASREEQEYQKWLKQQENIGYGFNQRLEEKRNAAGVDLSSQGDSEIGRNLFKNKQLEAKKVVEKHENTAGLADKLIKDDLRDNKAITRVEMDINLISAATMECLLHFIGLESGEVTSAFDATLNAQRIEVQGQKPQLKIKEIKRNLLPPKLVVIREQEDEQKVDKYQRRRRGNLRGSQLSSQFEGEPLDQHEMEVVNDPEKEIVHTEQNDVVSPGVHQERQEENDVDNTEMFAIKTGDDSTEIVAIKTLAKSNIQNQLETEIPTINDLKQNAKSTDNQAVLKQLENKLPWQNNENNRQLREKQWAEIDCNGKGFASLAEIDKGIKAVIQLPTLFDLKPVIMRAFQAAKTSFKSKSSNGDEYVTKAEYRYLLKYLRQYYEYWVAFDSIEISHDKRVNKEEFIKAMPLLEKWGINMSDEEAQWEECDSDGSGMILFSDFCDWAIKKNLDLDDDVKIQETTEVKLLKKEGVETAEPLQEQKQEQDFQGQESYKDANNGVGLSNPLIESDIHASLAQHAPTVSETVRVSHD